MQKYKLSSHATIIIGIIVAIAIVALVAMQLQSGGDSVANGGAGQVLDTAQDDSEPFE